MSDFDPFADPYSACQPNLPSRKQKRAAAVQDLALDLIREGKTPIEVFKTATEFYKLAEVRAAEANVEPGEDV